ncbi:MAG: hypothetical protein N7Q72_05535, partial [Spiroplasma sp. Tabriz.8]|nr:hypothetical protein [Spiroplasma sp. Tabriz.8]
MSYLRHNIKVIISPCSSQSFSLSLLSLSLSLSLYLANPVFWENNVIVEERENSRITKGRGSSLLP